MTPKNTICLWYDTDAHEAAQFYAATFPDSTVKAVRTLRRFRLLQISGTNFMPPPPG